MISMLIQIASLFTFINVPVATMREGPSEKTRVASEAIYSEPVSIIEESEGFYKIQTPDAYTGWVKKECLFQTDQFYPSKDARDVVTVKRKAVHLYAINSIKYGPLMTLPFESQLEVIDEFDDENGKWYQVKLVDGNMGFIQRDDVTHHFETLSKEQALELSKFFIDLPYTWGGRSSFGYDCSGFTQMIYRRMGINIPRDSGPQSRWEGFKEIALYQLHPGDLVFWGTNSNKIVHVGIYLGYDQFIHAGQKPTPWLQICNLNDHPWNVEGDYLTYRAFRTLKN